MMAIGRQKPDDRDIVAHNHEIMAHDREIVAHDREIGGNPIMAIGHVDASNSPRQDDSDRMAKTR